MDCIFHNTFFECAFPNKLSYYVIQNVLIIMIEYSKTYIHTKKYNPKCFFIKDRLVISPSHRGGGRNGYT